MRPIGTDAGELEALRAGRAFAVLDDQRVVRVDGSDARDWLHDLVTCDVASLTPDGSRPSLLLTPTGRIRATFAVARDDRGFLLFQASDQPDDVGALLAPYVLSSDVEIHDVTDEILVAVVGEDIPALSASTVFRPSVLGSGADLMVPRDGSAREALAAGGLREVGAAALETWRIRQGLPRMGPDFGQDALPAEVGLETTIDLTKGCFLGQESVAKIRNLGHPPRVLRHLRGEGTVAPGIGIVAGQDIEMTGIVTSAATDDDGGTILIARVPWSMAEPDLRTVDGTPLTRV